MGDDIGAKILLFLLAPAVLWVANTIPGLILTVVIDFFVTYPLDRMGTFLWTVSILTVAELLIFSFKEA